MIAMGLALPAERITVNLSPADLPFLESLSTDRAESVRAIAKGMVARVPGTPAFDARLADAARWAWRTISSTTRSLLCRFPAT